MDSPRVFSIRHGAQVAEIVPELGGALAAWYLEEPDETRHHWLRPASSEALAARDPLGMASFVLVPWCNRIRGGRFEWSGRQVQLTPATRHPHALHGVGWVRPWEPVSHATSRLRLELTWPAACEWPFSFSAAQEYSLDSDGLTITVSLTNTGAEVMPGGIGHHPYFPHRREGTGTWLRAAVTGMWVGDGELLPTRIDDSAPEALAFTAGAQVAERVLDNNFVGFGHQAVVTWPDATALTMTAESPLDYFVVYSPASADHFCAEAVSNCTDWLNIRAADTGAPVGGSVLAPGETLKATTRFHPAQSTPE